MRFFTFIFHASFANRAEDRNKETPLHVAAYWGKSIISRPLNYFFFIRLPLVTFLGREKVVRTLIELGAQVDAKDEYQETPLFNAAYLGKSVTHLY